MRYEKWQDIVGTIKDKFEVLDEVKEKEELGEDVNKETVFEKIESIEFNGPLGRIKLELVTRPIVLDKKTNVSRRIGAVGDVKYIYSDTEEASKFKAYKWDESSEDWEEMEGKMFE
ncbi:hypothetical protein HOD96_02755 [Candidatus Falkowbacteria bacterium]|jgi:hypothetical protein|nr:hypothetical protein [Candidatus Falkowbacteria bacterium]MBT4433503.1 hypothetical protein [Candidatus Falkowbacteria bacterium]